MNKKTLYVLLIVVIIAIISSFFLFSKEKPAIIQEVSEFPDTSSTRDVSLTEKTKETPTFDFQETQKEEQSSINKGLSFLTPEIEVFQEPLPIIQQFSSIFYENPQNQTGIEIVVPEKPALTEAEVEQIVFNKLYPDYFTEGLSFTQNVFMEQGFLNEDYETIESFDSEEKIFAFVNTIIDVFEEQGFYSEAEAVKFRTGANETWKSILDDERRVFKNELISSKLSEKIFANILFNTQKKASKQIINITDKLENMFLKKAQAEECFRSGGGGGIGANVSAPCCNCGLECRSGSGCTYVDDCGGGGGKCDVHFGCKNLYGKGKAIIWDPSSGICGVG